MRVLFTSLRNTSHFLPLVPFIEACRQRGHEVAVAAPAGLAERVASTGAAFRPFGHPGDDALRPIWSRMPKLSEDERKQAVIGEIFAGKCAAAALPALVETVERWRPSIILRESQEYAAIVAAEKFAICHVRVAITGRATEAESLALAAPSLDAHYRAYGLPPDPSGERVQREAVFTLFPASLEAVGTGLFSTAKRFRAQRKSAPPLPDWWGALEGPLVYLTLGTVAGSMEAARSAYAVALRAVANLPIRVLMTVGTELSLEALGDVPENVHVERFVPQDDVLPHAAAVICHGGSGTVLGTLAAGVPMVVTPLFADQPNNAERVAALGAGLALTPPVSPEALRVALMRVLEESSFRDTARGVAAEISELPSIEEAALEMEHIANPTGVT
jgi:UDP:flavonoid glycosyltransferase YjiC (YdhE family)